MYGAKITSIRQARGYNQSYVSGKLGISQKEYSKIERDEKAKLDDKLLVKIAEILGVSTDDIKSPTPIIMNFHDSPYSGQINTQNNNIAHETIAELKEQLHVKDSRIGELLQQIREMNLQLEKLSERKG